VALGIIGQGDQTATLSVEHSLVQDTSGGVFVLEVDLTNLAAAETLKLRLKTKLRSAGSFGATQKTAAYGTWTGVTADPVVVSIGPVAADLFIEATLIQTGGTGRVYPWKLYKIG
jgi:hypothetical protein